MQIPPGPGIHLLDSNEFAVQKRIAALYGGRKGNSRSRSLRRCALPARSIVWLSPTEKRYLERKPPALALWPTDSRAGVCQAYVTLSTCHRTAGIEAWKHAWKFESS
jgi:hypothetical protein